MAVGPMIMGKAIGCTLAFFFWRCIFMIAYLASLALTPGASFGRVFQFVGTAGLLTYCAAHFPACVLVQKKDRHGVVGRRGNGDSDRRDFRLSVASCEWLNIDSIWNRSLD